MYSQGTRNKQVEGGNKDTMGDSYGTSKLLKCLGTQ